mgnify:FL=1
MGSRCAEYLKNKGHEVYSKRIDVSDLAALKRAFKSAKPEVVINFAGVRAYPNIDWCEDHKLETVKVNVAGAINAMTTALESGAYPIQITSGCIYKGVPKTPFKEEDEPNFFGSFYSRMRIVLQATLKELPVLQARIRMPISEYPHPRNFIDKISSYPKVISMPNSVTLLEDMFPALEKLARIRPVGILNLTNDGYIEHEEILKAYKKIIDPAHSHSLISLRELQGKNGLTKAQRSNCVLDNGKAHSLGLKLAALDGKRLEKILSAYKKHLLEIKGKIH